MRSLVHAIHLATAKPKLSKILGISQTQLVPKAFQPVFVLGAVGATRPVLSTWSSSIMASFPPPKMMMSSLMATARCPCRGLGAGPVVLAILFHFRLSGFSAAGRAPLPCSPSTAVVVAIFCTHAPLFRARVDLRMRTCRTGFEVGII